MKSICLLPFVLASVMGGSTYLAAPLPVATVQHELKAHIPQGVELKQVGDVVALPTPVVAAAVPGYKVDGEIRQVTQTFPEPAPVEVDVKSLPVLSAPAPVTYAHAAVVPQAVLPKVELKSVELPAPVTYAHAPVAV